MSGSIIPEKSIIGFFQSDVSHMDGGGADIAKKANKARRQVLIEKELHPGGIVISFRSRSAAKARQARMSSIVRSGKSLRISSSVIPEARYSRMSYTVIRSPRIQGLPPRLPGSIVILSL